MTDKKFWREKIEPFTQKSNAKAWWQVLSTITLFAGLWVAYYFTKDISGLLVIPFALVMAFFILRFFVLMHDCGHGSLFASNKVNKFVGYLLGVLTGMPQYVWSKHHAYHHTTNGNWEKYKGPLSTISTQEYSKLSAKEQKLFKTVRNPLAFVPIGGFLYVFFNPRFNWMVGLIKLKMEIFKNLVFFRFSKVSELLREVPSKKWKTPEEFWHMTYNNLTLIAFWALMVPVFGAYDFFILHIMSLSLAGGLGILFFTVQHNFEHSYASDSAKVDYVRASLEGTSYLKLPALLNWFTADIAYHHIHHLSTSVPNYNLKACHRALKPHFSMVKRISLAEIGQSIKYLLWDQEKEHLVSIAEFERMKTGAQNHSFQRPLAN